jgi:hypothetical protein
MRRHNVLLLALVACVVLPPSAALAKTKNHLGGKLTDGSAVVLTLNKARTAVTAFNVHLVGDCSDQKPLQVIANLVLVADPATAHPKPGQRVLTGGTLSAGAFTATAETPMTYTTSAGDATGTMKETVTGKVSKTGVARGTYQASITLTTPTGTTIDCSTGARSWKALSSPRIYSGATGDGFPVVVELSARGTKVTTIRFAWEAACKGAEGNAFTDIYDEAITNFPINRRGAWGDSFSKKESHEDGGKADVKYAFGGKVTRTKATGTITITFTSTKPDGSPESSCESGTLRYTALN